MINPKDIVQPIVEKVEKLTTATVLEVPTSTPGVFMADPATIASSLGAVGVSILASVLLLRRKWSRDNVEVTKDRMEGNLLEIMAKRESDAIKRVDELTKKGLEDASKIAGLEEKNKYLGEEVVRLNRAMDKLEVQFDELRKSVRNLTTESRRPAVTKDTNPGTDTSY